jgi:hypothetical protein
VNLLRVRTVENAAKTASELRESRVALTSVIERYFESLGHPVRAALMIKDETGNSIFPTDLPWKGTGWQSGNSELGPRENGNTGTWFWTDPFPNQKGLNGDVPCPADCVFVPLTSKSLARVIVRLEGENVESFLRSACSDHVRFFFESLVPAVNLQCELKELRARNAKLVRLLKLRVRRYRELRWLTLIKSRRSATLLHDSRNILACMRSSAEWMLTGHVGRIPSALQKFLSVISSDLTALVSLVNRYEQIDELDRLRLQPVNLERLCREAIQEGAYAASQKSIELVPVFDKVPEIIGDKAHLRTMLQRLLTGTLKAADSDTVLRFRLFRGEDEVYIRIENPACISECVEEKRASLEAERKHSIDDPSVAILVQLHGGRVITSRASEGCRAMISLPFIEGVDRSPAEMVS